MKNPEKSFHQLGIVIMTLSALGMLGCAYGLMASLLYQLPWFADIQAFPLEEAALLSLMAKARFYFLMQLIAHGLIFVSAFQLMKLRGSGRWLLNAGAALLIVLIILLPLSFPAVQLTDNEEAILTYKELRSQLITMSFIWLLVWVGMVYYINRYTVLLYPKPKAQS